MVTFTTPFIKGLKLKTIEFGRFAENLKQQLRTDSQNRNSLKWACPQSSTVVQFIHFIENGIHSSAT